MLIAVVVGAVAVTLAMWRSGNDISYAVGDYEYLEQADTSDGHYLRTLALFVVGLLILFFL